MLYNKDNLTKFILSAVYQLYEFYITQCFNKEAVCCGFKNGITTYDNLPIPRAKLQRVESM